MNYRGQEDNWLLLGACSKVTSQPVILEPVIVDKSSQMSLALLYLCDCGKTICESCCRAAFVVWLLFCLWLSLPSLICGFADTSLCRLMSVHGCYFDFISEMMSSMRVRMHVWINATSNVLLECRVVPMHVMEDHCFDVGDFVRIWNIAIFLVRPSEVITRLPPLEMQ